MTNPFARPQGDVPPHQNSVPPWQHNGQQQGPWPTFRAGQQVGKGQPMGQPMGPGQFPGPPGFRPTVTAQSEAKRVGRKLLTTISVVSVIFMGIGFVAYVFSSADGSTELTGAEAIGAGVSMLIAVAAGGSMVVRREYPTQIFWLNAVLALVFPISPFGVLVPLTWVIAKRPVKEAAVSIFAAISLTAFILYKDFQRPTYASVFTLADPEQGSFAQSEALAYILLGIVMVAFPITMGFVTKYRNRADSVGTILQQVDMKLHEKDTILKEQESILQQSVSLLQENVQVTEGLKDELSRQQEREIIAREMHDTVAHQLSLISLQAGVLEVTTGDENVADSAKAMRESVSKALDEMRSLITSLRDSSSEGYLGKQPSLVDLDQLVAEAQESGAPVSPDIRIQDGELAPQNLTNAVYRITQEALTNAIRYGVDTPILLRVFGAPGLGISIDVINQKSDDASRQSQGSRAGIPGMQERAASVGGQVTVSELGDVWILNAKFPWAEPSHEPSLPGF